MSAGKGCVWSKRGQGVVSSSIRLQSFSRTPLAISQTAEQLYLLRVAGKSQQVCVSVRGERVCCEWVGCL